MGGLLEGGETTSLELSFVGLLADVDVILAVPQHAVDELRQLARGREDRDCTALITRDAAKRRSQGGLAALQGGGCHAKHARDAVGAEAIAALLEGLTTRDRRAGPQRKPRHEVVFGRK